MATFAAQVPDEYGPGFDDGRIDQRVTLGSKRPEFIDGRIKFGLESLNPLVVG